MATEAKCGLCGEPMPPGEEMFNFHGYSGPCPKPPLPNTTTDPRDARIAELESELAALRQIVADVETCRAPRGGFTRDSVEIYADCAIRPSLASVRASNEKCHHAPTWQAALHAAAEHVRNTNPERTENEV